MNSWRGSPKIHHRGTTHQYVGIDNSFIPKEVVVLKRQSCDANGSLKITFVLPATGNERPVSVLGSFNGWDPMTHPLKRRSNGTRSVTVEVPAGHVFHFKYLAEGGEWFCDPEVESVEVAEYSVHNSLLRT
ncbi:MAG TPA: isoamylase early set domain-containing protein [Ilumatobacteraceae bacterium]